MLSPYLASRLHASDKQVKVASNLPHYAGCKTADLDLLVHSIQPESGALTYHPWHNRSRWKLLQDLEAGVTSAMKIAALQAQVEDIWHDFAKQRAKAMRLEVHPFPHSSAKD